MPDQAVRFRIIGTREDGTQFLLPINTDSLKREILRTLNIQEERKKRFGDTGSFDTAGVIEQSGLPNPKVKTYRIAKVEHGNNNPC
jgi:hypothetical protein